MSQLDSGLDMSVVFITSGLSGSGCQTSMFCNCQSSLRLIGNVTGTSTCLMRPDIMLHELEFAVSFMIPNFRCSLKSHSEIKTVLSSCIYGVGYVHDFGAETLDPALYFMHMVQVLSSIS